MSMPQRTKERGQGPEDMATEVGYVHSVMFPIHLEIFPVPLSSSIIIFIPLTAKGTNKDQAPLCKLQIPTTL